MTDPPDLRAGHLSNRDNPCTQDEEDEGLTILLDPTIPEHTDNNPKQAFSQGYW